MRISDWSSDVCSSDLPGPARRRLRRRRDQAARRPDATRGLALRPGRRVGPPRSPRMAIRSQTQAKMRRFFRMLWTQIAYVAPAIVIVVAGLVFAYPRSEERRLGKEVGRTG